MPPNIWKLIPLVMKEEILLEKEKCGAEGKDESISQKNPKHQRNVQNTMNKRLGRQVLRYKPLNKICYLYSIAMNLYIF